MKFVKISSREKRAVTVFVTALLKCFVVKLLNCHIALKIVKIYETLYHMCFNYINCLLVAFVPMSVCKRNCNELY